MGVGELWYEEIGNEKEMRGEFGLIEIVGKKKLLLCDNKINKKRDDNGSRGVSYWFDIFEE
ncbi:hypothetical protein R3W88_014541 [Solanum pinnatisectum]|uniref:Uncharacterized protein n=1 Tax=Solanum pinnatisectum TaxID=50273 RepID=A0AAV9KTE7_9SOLN|nr:hypothetical protein R3W88_014541 [Solanum pinnatisectum]